MGAITTGVGLISGIDTAGLIESLITLESSGKFRLQERVGLLQTQQTALLDVNARLLAFKSAAGAFRTNDIFRSARASSSNDEVLTATAGTDAQPGSFTFIVKQLVSSSQQLSRGFATSDQSPLGLGQLSFEFGNGRLARDRSLEELNGGAGVDRGRLVISDRDGETSTIDLTDVTSINEVLERINGDDTVSVTATVVDDQLVITDTSGGTGTLSISNGVGDTTATDLGIAGSAAGAVLTGQSVYSIGGQTALSALNEGNGVLVRDNVNDLGITARDGTTFEVDFGRVDQPIDSDTLLADLNNGNGITLNSDEEEADLTIIAQDGTEFEVDLTGVETVGQLVTRISTETGGQISLSVETGDRFKLVDTGDPGGNLRVLGAGPNGDRTAEDLGLFDETGVAGDTLTGEAIPNTISDPAATTIDDIIDRINNAEGNEGRVVASIGDDGVSLKLTDTTGSTASNLIATSLVGNTTIAADLGLDAPGGVASDTLDGERLLGGLGSVLLSSINGGSGLGDNDSLTITDRNGQELDLTAGLVGLATLDEVIDLINTEAANQGVDVAASLNDTGNGLRITDTSGGVGNLVVTGNAAGALGIEADVAADSVRGTNLQLQYVSEATRLEDLNYGRGISTGGFRITDGLGDSAVVSIGGDEVTVYDLLAEINSKGLAINARINDNGDGILIEEDASALGGATPFVAIKVEGAGGSTAADLNILGESADIEGGFIDGSYERVVDLEASDSLDDVVAKINDAGIPVDAAIINTGSGATPFRLSLTSGITGRAGDLVADTGGIDLGLSVLTEGRDAKVFFGSENPADGFLLTSSTNSLDDVIEGVTIDLLAVSEDPVAVDIVRDQPAIVNAVRQLVTSFNDVMGRIKQYDFFNTETEERGLLLSDPTLARVRTELYRVATGRAVGVDGAFQFLSQVGIGFNGEGEMTFDQERFTEAYESDPQSVEAFFAAYEVEAGESEEIAEGVTIESDDVVYASLGFANLFDNLLDQLTNSVNGTTTLAGNTFTAQIGLLEDRIETLDERLAARRDQLTREFAAMETALARLQDQSSSLVSLASNVAASRTLFGS